MRIISQDEQHNLPYETSHIKIVILDTLPEPDSKLEFRIVEGETILGVFDSSDAVKCVFEDIIQAGMNGNKCYRVPTSLYVEQLIRSSEEIKQMMKETKR